MLKIIAYFLIPLLITLIAAYLYIDIQRRKLEEQNKKAILSRIATIKDRFKTDLRRLVEQNVLTSKELEILYRISNNFFVFQPVTKKNIVYCEQLLNYVISTIQSASNSMNLSATHQKIDLFINSLPTSGAGYNAVFYHNKLPKLIKLLLDSLEKIYETECENNIVELQNEESTAA